MATLIAASPERRDTRRTYAVAEKLRMLREVQESGGWLRRIAFDNGIAASTLQQWQHQEEELQALHDTVGRNARRVSSGGLGPLHGPEIESALKEFVVTRRKQSLHVSARMLVARLKVLDPTIQERISENALRLRVYCFMRRHNLSFRRVTHQAQQNRSSQHVIDDFLEYVRMKCALLGITDNRIANFDETNVYFSPECRTTIAERGSRTVSVRKPNSSNRASVMLGCTMDGHKFPPFVVYQGTKNKRNGTICYEIAEPLKYGYPLDMEYAVQSKAWMDEPTMLEWVCTVWKPYVDSHPDFLLFMLILDEAKSHMTASVRKKLADLRTEVEHIPGGYTSRLQTMDVGGNKEFKDGIRHCVDDWMVDNSPNIRPKRQDVANWISKAWNSVKSESLRRAWVHIGYKMADVSVEEMKRWYKTVCDDDSSSVDALAYYDTDKDMYTTEGEEEEI